MFSLEICFIRVHHSFCSREACKYIQEHLSINTDDLGRACILSAARTSMSSKLIGSVSEYFSEMIVDAVMAVKRTGNKGEAKYPIKAINVLKAHGGSAKESMLVNGYAVNCTIASQGRELNLWIFSLYLLQYIHATSQLINLQWLSKWTIIHDEALTQEIMGWIPKASSNGIYSFFQ